MLNMLREIELGVKAKFLTCDAEIVWHLYSNGEATAGTMFKMSRFSSTAFYSTLKRLAETSVVIANAHPTDRRSNVYKLCDQARLHISASLKRLIDMPVSAPQEKMVLFPILAEG